MKLAERNQVVLEVGSFASSDKVSSAEDVQNQPQDVIPQPFPIEFAGDHVSSWILVTSYHKRNRYLAGGRDNPSSHQVNHRFNKRTTFPPLRGENNARRNDPAFLSSRKEKSEANATIGRQQARSRVKLPPAELTVAKAVIPLHVKVLAVPLAATNLKVASLDAHSPAVVMAPPAVAAPADRATPKAASLTLSVSTRESQKCCLPTPLVATTTSSQGGKVPLVSLWRLVYGMLFALLLQLDLCGAAVVAAGANPPPPPPPRHTLWKDPPGAGAMTRGALGATLALPEETPRLRGHKELQSVHTSHPAVLNNFQNVFTNGTDSTNTTNSINYAWQSVYLGSYGAIACSDNGQHVVAGNYYGYLFTSNDYGATWNQSLSDIGYYFDIVSSNDGQYWAAVSHFVGIFVSSDYGQSWSLSSAAPIGWYSIASSANGQFLSAATYYDSIYTSSDFGQTWNVTSAVAANWQSIDSSESGQYLAAIASTFGLYTSSDYGVTWISSPSVGHEYTQWNTIAVSRSGQNLAVLADGAVRTSSDYGASWQVTSPSHLYWHFLVFSGSGHFIAGGNYGFLASDDFGSTWVATQSVPYVSLYNAALSGDGLSGYGYNHEAIYRMTRNLASQLTEPSESPTRMPSESPSASSTTQLDSILSNWVVTSAPADFFQALTCSASGQYVVASGRYLYTSNDYGNTWRNSLPIPESYSGITTSSNGQYWAAVVYSIGIYTSNNYGASWTLSSAAPMRWKVIASSANGQFLVAAENYGSIYTSNDYGQTWHITAAISSYWTSICSSETGQYLAAISSVKGVYTSSDYGVRWHPCSVAGNAYWSSLTMSSNGQYLVAVGTRIMYSSSDFGVSWQVASTINTFFIASSGSEHVLAASYANQIYESDDYGASWSLSSVESFSVHNVALSRDGQFVYGYDGNAIYRKTRNSASQLSVPTALPTTLSVTPELYTWQAISAPAGVYGVIGCSDNGQHVVAGNSNSGYLHTSHDYGATWNNTVYVYDAPYACNDVVSSSNGQYWATLSYKGAIYISDDYGDTWRLSTAAYLDWIAIASSNSGQFMTAVDYTGGIHTSNDYGHTWNTVFSIDGHWFDVTSSRSGEFLAAVAPNDGIYLSHDYGVTWNVTSAAGSGNWHNIAISSSGQNLVAANNGVVYVSNDFGASWTVNSPPNFWLSVLECSGNQYCLIAGSEKVFVSDDFGTTWIPNSGPYPTYQRAALSGDGQYAYGFNSNTVYRMTRTNVPQLAAPSALPTGPSESPTSNTCPGGTYNAQPGQPTSQCAVCPGGTYSTEGMNSCLSCPAGTFSTAWSSSCTQCPAGFYCLWGASSAVICPSGTISNAGASSCTACPIGQYSYPGSSTCLTCSAA